MALNILREGADESVLGGSVFSFDEVDKKIKEIREKEGYASDAEEAEECEAISQKKGSVEKEKEKGRVRTSMAVGNEIAEINSVETKPKLR